jgi:hypothetical protein
MHGTLREFFLDFFKKFQEKHDFLISRNLLEKIFLDGNSGHFPSFYFQYFRRFLAGICSSFLCVLCLMAWIRNIVVIRMRSIETSEKKIISSQNCAQIFLSW